MLLDAIRIAGDSLIELATHGKVTIVVGDQSPVFSVQCGDLWSDRDTLDSAVADLMTRAMLRDMPDTSIWTFDEPDPPKLPLP